MVNRCAHKLSDILFIALCTLICNGEDFEDMVEFGNSRYNWLKQYIELPNGIPCSKTFNRVLQQICPKELQTCLQEDGGQLLEYLEDAHLCLDGKKIKGVSPTSKGNQGFYILSAWIDSQNLCVGQSKVEDKSNEIVAIPKLLDSLHLQGSMVSIDAIGCQKAIAKQIVDAQGDYLFSLKKNQPATYHDAIWLFNQYPSQPHQQEWEYAHGRFETRKCIVIQLSEIQKGSLFTQWEGLSTLVKIESSRTIQGVCKQETRYYLSSAKQSPIYFNELVRGHWGIENRLHWHLDVTFNEDACRARTGYAPENLNILRKMALKKIADIQDKLSLKKRRYKASMDTNYLELVINLKI